MDGPDPRQQIPGLLETIDLDDAFMIEQFPSLAMLLTNGITVVGSVPGRGGPYHDPTFEQYAVIRNKPKAFGAMLRMMVVGPVAWDTILYPKYSNAKYDLFALAAQTGSTACMQVLFEEILRQQEALRQDPPQKVPTVDWARQGGPTLLESAVRAGPDDGWGAVKMLLQRGASWTEESGGGECTFIRVMRMGIDTVQPLYDQVPEAKAGIEAAVCNTLWSAVGSGLDRQIKIDERGRELPLLWGQVFNGQDREQAFLQGIRPEKVICQPIRRDKQQVTQVTVQQCEKDGCMNSGNLDQCNRCHKRFCESCRLPDDHGCEFN
jgi:hypothetical protein